MHPRTYEPSPSPAWLVVAVTTAAQMVVAMSNIVLPTIAPKVADALGVDPVLVGYHVGLTFGTAAVTSIYTGLAVTRWGAARTMQASMLFTVIGLALLAGSHAAFIALGSLFVGAGMGLQSPAAAHLLVHNTPGERRNLVFAIKQTGVPLGGVIVSIAAPALAVTVGWQWALAAIAAFAVGTLLATETSRAGWDADLRTAEPAPSALLGGIPILWRVAPLRWVCLAALLFSAIQRTLLSFTVVFLVKECGYGLVEAGIMLSLAQAGGSVTRIPWGWLADRLESGLAVLTILCVIMIVSSVGLVTLDPGWPKPLVYALFFVLGTSCVGWNGLVHAECARLAPPGTISLVAGGTSFFIYGGVVFGPPIFTLAYGILGAYGVTFGLMTVAGLCALGLLWLGAAASGKK